MENGKSLVSSTFKGQPSTESEKLTTSIGTGKEFDALVSTLKTAIKDGLIDKENLHRLSHGLGVKPEELASMVGVDKDNVEALDQDEAPEVHTQLPDVMEPKSFKEFRAETFGSAHVSDGVNEGIDPLEKQIALKGRSITSRNILARTAAARGKLANIDVRVSKLTNPLRKASLRRAEAQTTLGGKLTSTGKRLSTALKKRIKGININSRSGLIQAQRRVSTDPRLQNALANPNKRTAAEAEQITKSITGIGS